MARQPHRNNLANQFAETLTQAIQREQYRAGAQLPSVERLAHDIGVGRSTVREALRLLQARGLVEMVHGVGTFVTKERITRTTPGLLSFSEIVRERGMRPASVVLGKEVTSADDEVAGKLQIAPGEQVNVLRRLRLADDWPVSLETAVTSHARFPDLLDQDWGPQTSLYGLLKQRYGVNPHYSLEIVRAVLPGRTISRLLQIETKRPALLVENLTMDEEGTPIEFGRSYYSSDRFEYRIVVKQEAK